MTLPADTASPAIVEMRGITISFPGVLALDNVDFFVRPGEVHSLMGGERRGEVHPHQGIDRRLCHRQRVDRRHRHQPGLPRHLRMPRPRASRPCTRRSTCARTSPWARTSCSATSPAGAGGSIGRLCIGWQPTTLKTWGSRSTPDRCSPTIRLPFSSWSPSAGQWCWTPRSSSSTSRPPAWTVARSNSFSR